MSPFFIGIAGGTASGKSCFCDRILERAPKGSVSVLLLDYYYRPQSHLSLEERAVLNFDHPDAFEFELLIQHLKDLKGGRSIEAPMYDFSTHDRTGKTVRIEPTPVVIVEGILVLHREEIRSMLDFSVFLDAREEVRLERRLNRDVRERGRTPDSVRIQWRDSVQPMHSQFCEVTAQHAHLVLNGETIEDSQADLICKRANLF